MTILPANSSPAEWTLVHERQFRAFAVRTAAAARLDSETWIIAPVALLAWYREALTTATPAAVVACRDWEAALDTLESRLLLPSPRAARRADVLGALLHALRAAATAGTLPPGVGAAVATDPLGVAEALLPSVETALEYGYRHDAPPDTTGRMALVRTNLALLYALKDAVVTDLRARGLATPTMRWAAVADALRDARAPGLPVRLIVDGIDTLDPVRLEVLTGLADQLVDVLLPPWLALPGRTAVQLPADAAEAPKPAVRVRHPRDLSSEAALAVTWAREKVQAGARLGALVVMAPAGQGYEAALEAAFRAADIPVSVGRHLPLAATEPFQALRAYARARTGHVDMIDLVTLLRSTHALEGAAGAAFADHLYETLPATWAVVHDKLAASALPEEIRQRVAPALARLVDQAQPLLDELERFWADWAPYADPTIQLACQDALRAYIELMGAHGSPAELPVAIERLGELAPRYLRPPGEVLAILTTGPYAPLAASDLLILGFVDGRFPSLRSHLPLLGASELAALAAAGRFFPSPALRAAYEMRNIWRLLDIAPDVTLAVPERGAAGEPLRPSPLLGLVTIKPDEPAPEAPLTGPEWRRAAARALGAGQLLPGLAALAAQGEAGWTAACFAPPPTFRLAPAVVAGLSRPLSPSALDTLLACPFAFYATSLLRLEARPPARALAWNPATAGQIAHAVMEGLLTDTPDAALAPAQVGPMLARTLRDGYPGIAPAHHRLEIETLRKDLEAFVQRYAALAAELGVVGGRSEWWFGGDARHPATFPLDDEGKDVLRVRGVIDRIMLRDGAPIAIDFKSGDVAKFRAQRAAGLGAQVALYSWAVAELGFGRPAAFAYLTLTGRRTEMDVVLAEGADLPPLRAGVSPAETLEKVETDFRAAVAEALGRVNAGLVEPVTEERAAALAGAKAHPCTYCEHDLLCRSKRERGR